MNRKNYKGWLAAVALGAGLGISPAVFAQEIGLQRQAQLKAEQDAKRQQQQQNQANKQLTKQERRAQKREREELNNMPKPVRQTLRAETANGKNVDYYRVQGQGGAGEAGREFGAKFTDANGHQIDLRVDRQGKVIDRDDLTATAAAQAPGTAAQQPAPATPTTPAPAPGSATASKEAPESGNAIYRRLQANEVPANIRAQFDKDTANAKDVRYYRTKYGSQLAYEAKWQDPKTGKDMRHYVSDAGQTLVRGESVDDDNERLASASDRRDSDRNRDRDRDRDRDRRDANRDRDHRDDEATTAGSSSSATIKTGRAELTDLPRPVQTYFRRSTEGAKDVKFYNTKYGSQQAYRADFTGKDGKEHSVILDSSGKVLSEKGADAKK